MPGKVRIDIDDLFDRNEGQDFGVMMQRLCPKCEARQNRSTTKRSVGRDKIDRRRGSAVDQDRCVIRITLDIDGNSIQKPVESNFLRSLNINADRKITRTADDQQIAIKLPRPFRRHAINSVLIRSDDNSAKFQPLTNRDQFVPGQPSVEGLVEMNAAFRQRQPVCFGFSNE